jgi:hypothetical protein
VTHQGADAKLPEAGGDEEELDGVALEEDQGQPDCGERDNERHQVLVEVLGPGAEEAVDHHDGRDGQFCERQRERQRKKAKRAKKKQEKKEKRKKKKDKKKEKKKEKEKKNKSRRRRHDTESESDSEEEEECSSTASDQ